MGDWKEDGGLRLSTTPEAFPWWSASWEMKKGESRFEFKFAIRRQDDSAGHDRLIWEELGGGNRIAEVGNMDDLHFGFSDQSPGMRANWTKPSRARSPSPNPRLGRDAQYFSPKVERERANSEEEEEEAEEAEVVEQKIVKDGLLHGSCPGPIYTYLYLSIYLSIYMSIYLYISICLYIYISISLSISISISIYIYLYIYLYIHIYLYIYICRYR